ncbi:hypothetical protein BJY59DRAFT_705010 [Rhodotorula toruloides]
MEYFSLSPFFDKASNNARLRMQMRFSRGEMKGVHEEAELGCVHAVDGSCMPDESRRWVHRGCAGRLDTLARGETERGERETVVVSARWRFFRANGQAAFRADRY